MRLAFSDEISAIIPSLIARVGDVNPTFSSGNSQYGNPQINPLTEKPLSLNEAEFEGLKRLRNLKQTNPEEYNRILLQMEQHVQRGY